MKIKIHGKIGEINGPPIVDKLSKLFTSNQNPETEEDPVRHDTTTTDKEIGGEDNKTNDEDVENPQDIEGGPSVGHINTDDMEAEECKTYAIDEMKQKGGYIPVRI